MPVDLRIFAAICLPKRAWLTARGEEVARQYLFAARLAQRQGEPDAS